MLLVPPFKFCCSPLLPLNLRDEHRTLTYVLSSITRIHTTNSRQTFLEAVRARYGMATHFVYIVFGLFTNILVTAMLLTGGSAVISSLTGVPTAAACFLLPLGVVVYTMFGGIKATFLTDYVHTVILLIILLIFAFTTYATGDRLGSPGAVYDRLQELSAISPVPGNAGGSYLTMRSKEGAIFFVINIIGNFGTVFMDNGCEFSGVMFLFRG